MKRLLLLISLTVCCLLVFACSAPHYSSRSIQSRVKPLRQSSVEPPHRLPSLSLDQNSEVRKKLIYFQHRDPNFIRYGVERAEGFLPEMVEILESEGLPRELLAVALIESGFKPAVRSRSGAVGVWQFMKGTARVYGLHVGLFSDERKDPLQSTVAAAKHLRDLYWGYRDWYLALAAYNAGPAAVDRALQRSGTRDFWHLSRKRYLPKQTRDYVPKIIAANLILQNPGRYGMHSLPSAYLLFRTPQKPDRAIVARHQTSALSRSELYR